MRLIPTIFIAIIAICVTVSQAAAQDQLPGSAEVKNYPELRISCSPSSAEAKCSPGPRQICINAETQVVRDAVVSLSKNQQVLVTVYNKNPFAYEYRLHLDETTIADDDVSGFLKLFLPGTSATDAQQAGAEAKSVAGSLSASPLLMEVLSPTSFAGQVAKLSDQVSSQISMYQAFAERYENLSLQLNKADACDNLQPLVNKLYSDALRTRDRLMSSHAAIKELISEMQSNYGLISDGIDSKIAKDTADSDAASLTGKKGKEAEAALKDLREAQKALKNQQGERKQLDDFKQSALRLECMYLSFSKTQLPGIQTGVIEPLEQAATNQSNFWRIQAVGPYSEPTIVTVTNQRKSVESPQPLAPIAFPGTASSGDLCSKDLLNANDFAGVQYSVPSASSGASGAGATTGTGKTPPNSQPATSSKDASVDDTGYEPDGRAIVHFGGQRFITAAGAAFGLLQKPEFSPVSGTPTDAAGNPNGTAVTNIVGLKSESDVRVSPFLFLHTRLLSLTHSSSFLTNEALFLTVGVGAQTDNQGARAEYLVGFSHSLADQRFFMTVGTYIGKQQVLKNGLFLGRDVSGLQGDLPIDEVRHFKLGFALSWRFNVAGSTDKSKQAAAGTGGSAK